MVAEEEEKIKKKEGEVREVVLDFNVTVICCFETADGSKCYLGC
jgi:hypothetical protein